MTTVRIIETFATQGAQVKSAISGSSLRTHTENMNVSKADVERQTLLSLSNFGLKLGISTLPCDPLGDAGQVVCPM